MPPRVLLAHSKSFDRTETELSLKALGWNVFSTTSYKAACEMVTHSQFQFILLSISLDDGDGYTLTKLIRETDSQSKDALVVATSRSGITDEAAISRGLDGVINLECSREELEAQLQKWVAKLAFRMWKTEGMPRLSLDRIWMGGA